MTYANIKKKIRKIIGATLLAGTFLVSGTAVTIPAEPVAHAQTVPASVVQGLIYDYALQNNPSLSSDQASYIAQAVVYYSYEYGVNPLLIASIIRNESSFNP